jgi:hypothetical protein
LNVGHGRRTRFELADDGLLEHRCVGCAQAERDPSTRDTVAATRAAAAIPKKRCRKGHDLTLPGAVEVVKRTSHGKKRMSNRCAICRREFEIRLRKRKSLKGLPVKPFTAWLRAWLAEHPDVTAKDLAVRAGGNDTSLLRHLLAGDRQKQRLQLETVDRYLLAAGEPASTLEELYPTDGSPARIPTSRAARQRQRKPRCATLGCTGPEGHGRTGRFCARCAKRLAAVRDEYNQESFQTRRAAKREVREAAEWGAE